MNAEQAYNSWKSQHKMDLRVLTEKELFEIGFNSSRQVIHELEKVINEMERESHKLKSDLKKARKSNKDEPA